MGCKSDHDMHDLRSLIAHRLVARKLLANPELMKKAWKNLEDSKKVNDLDAFVEWETVLRAPLGRICEFISKPSQVATRLRQSSPFFGLITKEERDSIYEQVKLGSFNSRSGEYNR